LHILCFNSLKPKERERERERERVIKDSKRVEAKRKWLGGEVGDTLFLGGGDKEHLIVRRFPDIARSSF
jgi:hypothetical protein